jgi:hypothetical protein
MPLAIAQKYLAGPHSRDFSAFIEKHDICVVEEAAPETSPTKRTPGAPAEPPAPKKLNAKAGPEKIVDGATLTGALLFKAKVTSVQKSNVELQIRDGGTKALVNLGTSEVNIIKFTIM